MMKSIFFAAISICILFAASMLAAQESASETIVGTNSQPAGLAAWSKFYEIASHPRCANCHVVDGRPMWSGQHYGEPRKHPMYVGGDPEMLLGQPGLMCTTCHMAENSKKLHGPPGAEVWHLPPAEMTWWETSSAEICAQIKDPTRNGGRTLDEIGAHVAEDNLVAWGWRPGPGREPAPYSAAEAAEFITTWAASGAPCPSPQGE